MKISTAKACSVVNPKAANRKWLRRTKLRAYLQKNLPNPVHDDLADKESTIRKVKAFCADSDLIVAIGGDGTIADVIQGIRESGREKNVHLGIIPLGSGNAFRKALKIPLASGESMSTDWLIKNYIQPRAVDIVQPDLDTVGLTGGRSLSHFCRQNQVRLIPHNWGTAIRTAGTLHWMSCLPPMAGPAAAPTGTFEFDQTENPLRTAVVKQRIEIDPADGCIQVPMRPGLGIDVVREAVEEYRTELLTIS